MVSTHPALSLLRRADAFGLRLLSPRSLLLSFAVLFMSGVCLITLFASITSLVQLATTEEMRGRVMAVYALLFLGSTPLGGPLIGWISQQWGPRMGLAVGGGLSLLAAAWAFLSMRRSTAEPHTVIQLPADEEETARLPPAQRELPGMHDPQPYEVPRPGSSRSTSTTRRPSCARRRAQARPMTPAPTTRTTESGPAYAGVTTCVLVFPAIFVFPAVLVFPAIFVFPA